MKRKLAVLTIIFGTIGGVAADEAVSAPSDLMIDQFGLHHTLDGLFTIDVSQNEGKLGITWGGHFETLAATNRITGQVSRAHNASITNSYSMSGWKAKDGWFVFVENKSRVWSYDGAERLWLLVIESDGSSANYELPCFPCPIPAQAVGRVSAEMRKEIQNHQRAEPGGAADGSQPSRSETNGTSAAADFRR